MKENRKNYTPEFKREAVVLALQQGEVCRKFLPNIFLKSHHQYTETKERATNDLQSIKNNVALVKSFFCEQSVSFAIA